MHACHAACVHYWRADYGMAGRAASLRHAQLPPPRRTARPARQYDCERPS